MFSSLFLCASLAPLVSSVVVRAKTNSCPLAECQNRNNAADGLSFMELSSTRSTSTSKAGCSGNTFMPAHFTCSKCDTSTCKGGCDNVVCDINSCVGKFFTQECWCKKPLNKAVDKMFCDSDCTGGLCDTKGLTCGSRETSCKPWWWCKLPPPKEPSSFLQTSACAKKESAQSLNERYNQAKKEHAGHLSSASFIQEKSKVQSGKRQIDAFTFAEGSFVCESALLPKPDEDPVTLAHSAPGFLVLDGRSCKGGYFTGKCFCYDKFLYLRGKDPMVTELMCDTGCGLGDCAGKTCGVEPPQTLPAPAPPPPVDPLVQELAQEGMLRNYGTQMSPVK